MGTAAQDRTARNPQQSVVDQIARALARQILEQLTTNLVVNNLSVGGDASITESLIVGGAAEFETALFNDAVQFDSFVTMIANGLRLSSSTPASASAAGVAGTVTRDANFIYVCVATNTWKRVAIATW